MSALSMEFTELSSQMTAANISQTDQAIVMFNRFFCGNHSGDLIGQLLSAASKPTQFDDLREQLRDSTMTQQQYEYDNTTTPACNWLFQQIESSPPMRALWRMIKPYIRGKILYTPETVVTKRIMEKLNSAFAIVKEAHDFSNNLANFTLPQLKTLLYNNTAQLAIIKLFFDSPRGEALLNNTFLHSFLGKNYNKTITTFKEDLDRFLDPNNTVYREETFDRLINITTNTTEFLECFDWDKVVPYNTETEAMVAGMELVEDNKLWALVVFINPGNITLNPNTTYKIRMSVERVDNTEFLQDTLQRPGARLRPAFDLKYITYGFAYLQDMIDHLVIQEQTGVTNIPGTFLQQFPYPCYVEDRFVMAISRTFPLFMVLSWVYTCAMIVKSIVYEKEQRLKETMRVMGLGNLVHWLGWFIDSIVPMMVTITMLTAILVYGNILKNADPMLVFTFLSVYGVATIAQAFLLSTFFSKANLSAACGGIIFFILYLPYSFLVRWILFMSPWIKASLALSSNVAFGLGAGYLSLLEERGTGVSWPDLWQSPLYGDDFNLGLVLVMLMVDTFLYFLLTWYIEAVFPGEFGIPKCWYFLVTKSYWCGTSCKTDFTDSSDKLIENEVFVETHDNFEAEPRGMRKGVAVHNLGMVYSNGKVAVNNLNINFYENQITSFLGHNGAGKTTTISILTGMFPPTSGTAYINGLDIRKQMDSIRSSLGMCPQHNVLFNLLTVEETLWFFGLLRGKDTEVVRPEIEHMIQDLGLPHKATSLTQDLSGGMQRKLSVAVAFIGGSKTVILDEPTSGVDPYSRRSIWELLIKYKKDRTVLLTTHYMDEADLLGDRIAIIADGQLQCCGSSVFLKSRFGTGYYLTVELTAVVDEEENIKQMQVSQLTEVVSECVSSARVTESVGDEVVFLLPQGCQPQLPKLFHSLDERRTNLHINSYGISDTSLEEIFLRVTEDQHQPAAVKGSETLNWLQKLRKYFLGEIKTKPEDSEPQLDIKKMENPTEKEIVIRRNGTAVKYLTVPVQEEGPKDVNVAQPSNKLWRQFLALHIKRYHHNRRNKKALFSELIIPAVFVCITLLVTSILPELRERPPLPLNPWIYPPPHYMFLSLDSTDNNTAQYHQEIQGPLGLGAECLPEHRADECRVPTIAPPPRNISMFGPSCSCDSGAQVCPVTAGLPDPPYFMTASDDTMYDLTGSNISDWILKTQKRYDRTRIGGFSLGVVSPVPDWDLTSMLGRLVQAVNNTGLLWRPLAVATSNSANTSNNTQQRHVMVWYFNKAWASSVGYMNALNNVVLRSFVPNNQSQYSINTINHPMNFTRKQLGIEIISTSGVSLLHAIAVLFALSFVPASFTLYLIEERVTNSKHLQMVSGVNRLIYWLQTYTWDLACYLLAAALCVFVFLAFDEKSYISPTNFPGLVALLLLYGWSCTALMYPFSFYFDVPSSSFVALACCNMFIGIITTVTTFVLSVFDDEELKEVSDVLKVLFLVFPHYCLGSGLLKLASSQIAKDSLAAFDIVLSPSIFAWGFLGQPLLCMFLTGILFFFITLVVEFKLYKTLFSIFREKNMKLPAPQDEEDVATERNRIRSGDTRQDILLVKDLAKVYKTSGSVKPAVNQVCFGVRPGECFGLLGLNGAGKTSTFKMLTGATAMTRGSASVQGHDVASELDTVRSLLGYCPQFDALDPLLTPREHLELYARLRNIPRAKMQQEVDLSLKYLRLGHYSDRLAGTLSGGNKRKLSTAIALLGNPPIVYLDEPTTGMDPKSRRFLWSCIQDVNRQGRSVILTSHSMEECQALCTRLTIMVNGEFKCLGSSQHLKSKYGGGYSLIMRCQTGKAEQVEELVRDNLSSASLVEAHYNQMRYQLTAPLDLVFQTMEEAKQSGLILDFSVSQTTLEEVFLRFASEQSDAMKSKSNVFRNVRRAIVLQCNKCCKGTQEQEV
ncbi:phospholipid-transporting ATPase ABCA1-like isoform X1 [Macrosteles quadrilineatus]|uniref:phospholipid-transporting ATPase ABCA1-like isoform X1 n=2 Tax=Macrosteles quadrilineatus TaxID=74068 RepID=UPI0023E0D8C3|nr:phospholipid-transporting ATPase ABCA1-like isoform X1 [Macrosteles quadrilineatus]